MPIYTFRDKETNEEHDKFMKFDDREQYLLDNPNLEVVIGAPAIADSVRIGVTKTDNGFKEVLQKIHSKTAGSKLNTTTNI